MLVQNSTSLFTSKAPIAISLAIKKTKATIAALVLGISYMFR